MKTNRTYSIDVGVVKDLQQKSNQSQFVEDAIKAKLYPSFSYTILQDAEKSQLLYQLLRLYDTTSLEFKVIHDLWEIENKKHIEKVRSTD